MTSPRRTLYKIENKIGASELRSKQLPESSWILGMSSVAFSDV